MKTHELALLAKRIAGSSFGMLQQQVEETRANLAAVLAAIEEAHAAEAEASAACKELQAQAAELKRAREVEFAKRQTAIAASKRASVSAAKALAKVDAKVEEKTIALEELRELSAELVASVAKAQKACDAIKATFAKLQEKCDAAEGEYAQCHAVRLTSALHAGPLQHARVTHALFPLPPRPSSVALFFLPVVPLGI